MSDNGLNLRKLYQEHKEELTREFTTDQGLTLTVRYINEVQFDRLATQSGSFRNSEAKRQAYRNKLVNLVATAVAAWDMTPEIMARYLDMDVSQLPERVPCEPGVVADLLHLSDTFFGQVNDAVRDLASFREERVETEEKNLPSSPGGGSTQGESPAATA